MSLDVRPFCEGLLLSPPGGDHRPFPLLGMSLQGARLSLRARLVDLVASPMPVPVRAVTLHAVLPCREHPLVLQPGFSFFHSLPEIHQGACLKAESKTEDRDKSTDFDVERRGRAQPGRVERLHALRFARRAVVLKGTLPKHVCSVTSAIGPHHHRHTIDTPSTHHGHTMHAHFGPVTSWLQSVVDFDFFLTQLKCAIAGV